MIKKKKICLIDYKLNNISSVIKALNECKVSFDVIEDGKNLGDYSHIILPGIGSFEAGVRQLKSQNFFEKLKNLKENTKILGICLGMQLLFEGSEECDNSEIRGLGLIKGKVRKMKDNLEAHIYIPHSGWNSIKKKKDMKFDIKVDKDYYFANSYHVCPINKDDIKFVYKHGIEYCAVVNKEDYFGFQFHPEKSENGIRILNSFCKLD